MGWTHEAVYQALVERGERVKQSANNPYVTLYHQETNCAILYASDSSAVGAPLHTNAARADWRADVFDRLEGAGAVAWREQEQLSGSAGTTKDRGRMHRTSTITES